ncbi:MAG: GGDEF domain-containing protein [Lachnospiraceae bacterium]|nr:GGDEF domain-containing protein [Lachnospiraceae bacterium]
MNVEQIKENLNKSWQKSMLEISIIGFFLMLFSELFTFIMYTHYGFIKIEVSKYILLRMVTPCLLNFIDVLFMVYVYKNTSNKWIQKHKDDLMCYALFFMCMVISIVHNHYHVIWIMPCLCQYINSVYANKKGIRNIYLLTNLLIIINVYIAYTENEYALDYIIMTGLCGMAMILSIYFVVKLLHTFHDEQMGYIEENYKSQMELIEELNIEPMTGLFNRNAFSKTIDKIINDNMKNESESYLIMLDIDHFKRVNDTYGHICGDKVILGISGLIKNYMDLNVKGYRYGGEEFALVFEHKTYEEVFGIVEEICSLISDMEFEFDKSVRITMSAGVAKYKNEMKKEEWISVADKALYTAKENGRNQIQTII